MTQYVARPAVEATLRFIAGASSGSEVCFTYVPQEVIEGHSTRAGAETAGRFVAQRTWVTGFDPARLATELGALGLDLVEDVGAADYQARYLVPRGRALVVFEIERAAGPLGSRWRLGARSSNWRASVRPTTGMREESKGPNLAFLFVAGDQEGLNALVSEAERVGLKASGSVHIAASNLPKAFGAGAGDAVRDRAREIGRQLLKTSEPSKDNDWIEKRSLGYGNNGHLLVFPYNTPTQTLTLLWSEGTVDGWRWLPLFPRRAKR